MVTQSRCGAGTVWAQVGLRTLGELAASPKLARVPALLGGSSSGRFQRNPGVFEKQALLFEDVFMCWVGS